MITRYEVPAFLEEEMPQIAGKIYHSKVSIDVYTAMSFFSDYTKHAVIEHNFNLAKKCFSLAEILYRNGDRLVRLLIENTFVYSFSSFMSGDRTEKMIIKSIIPVSLYSLYMKQVMTSGC